MNMAMPQQMGCAFKALVNGIAGCVHGCKNTSPRRGCCETSKSRMFMHYGVYLDANVNPNTQMLLSRYLSSMYIAILFHWRSSTP